MIVMLVVAFAALLLGNAVLRSSDRALYETFSSHISGDLSVAAASDSNFTLFGSDSLLIGEYQVAPTIVDFDDLDEFVRGLPQVDAVSPVVTGLARIEIGNRRHNRTILGVDFERFERMFPDLELIDGGFPGPGERGIVVQDDWPSSAVGRSALLTSAHDFTFTLREAPVTGRFRFPVDDELLDRVALVDAETARALSGYVFGAGGVVDLPETEQAAFDSDFDDMFAEADAFDEEDVADEAPDDADRDPVAEIEAYFAETAEEAAADRETIAGAWNFLLISTSERGDVPAVQRRLSEAGFDRSGGYVVRDWRGTVGGNAEIAWYLQLMFNVGVLFVAAGAAMITTNALVLSVLERTGEIGTMRALGATRPRVAAMIAVETVAVVLGAAIAGIALGTVASAALNRAAIVIDNPYIDMLFGGEPLSSTVSFDLLWQHLLAGLVLAVVALIYPLKRALGILPVEAMAE